MADVYSMIEQVKASNLSKKQKDQLIKKIVRGGPDFDLMGAMAEASIKESYTNDNKNFVSSLIYSISTIAVLSVFYLFLTGYFASTPKPIPSTPDYSPPSTDKKHEVSLQPTPTLDSKKEKNFWIQVRAKVIEDHLVKVSITTNIPSSPVLSASIALEGLKEDDIAIGTGFVELPVVNGVGEVIIDIKKNAIPIGGKLPNGKYNVEVGFHPRWKKNISIANENKINEAVEGTAPISLFSPKNPSMSSFKFLHDGQRWILQNFYSNYPWNPNFWRQKFGEIQEVKYCGSGNPNILKVFYLKQVDMSLLVNDLRKQIITFRSGLTCK